MGDMRLIHPGNEVTRTTLVDRRASAGWGLLSHPSQKARRMGRIPREEQMFLPAVAAMGHPIVFGRARNTHVYS